MFSIAEEEPKVIDEESNVIEVDLRFGQSFLRMSRVFDVGQFSEIDVPHRADSFRYRHYIT
jgi:hypothetical protein